MKTVKIFLASSIEDLKDDRVAVGNYFRQLNDIYIKKGIYFELVMCEDYDNAMSADGKQSQYDREIEGSELCFFLFFRKAGEYTKHEFEIAMESFKDKAKPKIVTYFRDVSEGESISDEVKAFMSMLDGEFKHYYNTYGHIDTLKLGIIMQIKLLKLDSTEVKVEDGEVKLEGVTVAKSENVPILNGNGSLRELTLRKRELQKRARELEDAFFARRSDENRIAYGEAVSELDEVSKELTKLEREVLDFMTTVAEMTSDGRVLTHRQKEALEYFNKGDYDTAQRILEDAERENELERAENKVEAGKSEIIGYIEEELLWIDAEKAKGINKESADRIFEKYEKIMYLTLKHSLDRWVLYDYVDLLHAQKHYAEAISVAEDLYGYYRIDRDGLTEEREAMLLNIIALLYHDIQLYSDSERYYLAAVALYEKLYGSDSEYASDLAIAYNNLAVLYYATERFEEAEEYHLKVIGIYDKLEREHPDCYTFDLAIGYNNLAILLYAADRYTEAEGYYLKAIAVYEALSKEDPHRYEPAVADGYNNLGVLYSDSWQNEEAESYLVKSVEMRERLSHRNPDAYENDLATSLVNLANLLKNTERFEEAEGYYLKALEIRKRLCNEDPDAIEPNLAMVYWNLGILYEAQSRTDDAVTTYESAREILLRLNKKNPDLYSDRIDTLETWISQLKGKKKGLLSKLFGKK